MKITFTTKEESNLKRQQDFLALTGSERFVQFLELQEAMMLFPTHTKPEAKNNFVIKLYSEND